MSTVIDRVRQPAYTGENRCIPCTAVNLVIAGALAAVLAVVAIPLGAVVLIVSLLAIYLRGYLVPGTPTLTSRLFPDSVLALFGKEGAKTRRDDALDVIDDIEKPSERRARRVDAAAFVREAGAFEDGPNGLAPTEQYREAVSAELADLREAYDDSDDLGLPLSTVATLFDADTADISRREREYPEIKVDTRIRNWPSGSALVADVAIDRTMRNLDPEWAEIPVDQRVRILEALRSYQAGCPLCAGDLQSSSEPIESCCASGEVIALSCPDCGRALLERSPTSDTWLALADV